jgi:tRNA uridine 5-carbamoylmethylation protein Kti12
LTEPLLVIITGPVGGGKSTVALALADHFRATGQMTAVIDLDRVYIMARQIDGYGEASIWAVARRGAAALADSFYADGIQVVIVEGEFFTRDELETLYDALSTPVRHCFATLAVTYQTALCHVAGDPTRGMSRDPEFLRRLYAQFEAARPFLHTVSFIIEADHLAPGELAEMIHDAAISRSDAL